MIHNPQVNDDLKSKEVRFLQDNSGKQIIPFNELTADDIVLIPAFGTTLQIEQQLRAIGIQVEHYDTTCPFVEKVWNRSEAIAKENYTIIIHGKPTHEETRATFSHASATAPTVVVKDMKQTEELAKYITGQKSPEQFYIEFKNQYGEGFDVTKHLERIGVVNQTTMLASDTQAIADYLKEIMIKKYSLTEQNIKQHFADTRDTLCYATNDNQSAVIGMLDVSADLAIVVGGYNSSNTSHLVELCEEKLPVYFINSADKILSKETIMHYNFHTKTELVTQSFLPEKQPVNILITSGASCPDALVEGVVTKLANFYPASRDLEKIMAEYL
jgi:4-hydroxy-3-methylbut-2-enyl diphosphate reductase